MGYDRHALESPHKPEVRLAGGFRTNGASNPTAAMIYGNFISTVIRDGGAGIYLVTLKPEWRNKRCINKSAALQLAAVGDSKVVLGPYNAALGTLRVWTVTGAAAADIASDVDNIVHFELAIINSDIPNGSPAHDS